MTSERVTRRLAASMVAALSSAALLSGCTPPAPPPSPEVVWSPAPPSGDHEKSDWVAAIRTYMVEWAKGFNNRDYTDPDLLALVGASQLSSMADMLRSWAEDDEYYFLPGPVPFTVLEVEETGDTAVVRTCQPIEWRIDSDHPDSRPLGDGHIMKYNLRRDDDGTVSIESFGGSETRCDLTGVSVGLFDPQPDVTRTYSPDDVKEIEDGWLITPSPDDVKGP